MSGPAASLDDEIFDALTASLKQAPDAALKVLEPYFERLVAGESAEPETVGALRHRLGIVMWRLGQLSSALGHLVMGLDFLDATRHPRDHVHAEVINAIGVCLQQEGRHEDAIGFYNMSAEILATVMDLRAPFRLEVLDNLAYALEKCGDFAQSIELSEQVWKLRREVLGDAHAATLNTLGGLVTLHGKHGDLARAIGLASHEAAVYHRASGYWDHKACATRKALFGYLLRAGDIGRARELLEHSFDFQPAAVESGKAEVVAGYWQELGSAANSAGAHELGVACHEAVMERLGHALAPDADVLLAAESGRGKCLIEVGQYDAAVVQCRKAYLRRQALLPRDHPDIAHAANNLAEALHGKGEFAEALSFYEEALRIDRVNYTAPHSAFAVDFNNLGRLRLHMGGHAEAIALLWESIEQWHGIGDEEHMGHALLNLQVAYQQIGDVAAARNCGQWGREISGRRAGSMSSRPTARMSKQCGRVLCGSRHWKQKA